MRIRSLTTFFVVYVIILSLIPLVHQTFVAQSTWLGYGTGAYAFQSPNYFVLFNDPYDGSSKPNIHVNPIFAPNQRISLVEFSDWTSYVNGYNLFKDFNVTMNASSKNLDATYTRTGLVVHKFVDISAAGRVIVRLEASKEIVAHIEMWKWIMTSINGFTIKNAPKPMLIPITRMINFTFKDQALLAPGNGAIELSRVPTQIEIWPFENGFNRVTVDFINSEMTFSVLGSAADIQQKFPVWSYTDLPYVLPLIAIAVVSTYLLVERYEKKIKDHTHRSNR